MTDNRNSLPDASHHARYIGRVGGLAIALGVGLSIAGLTGAPTASADSDTTGGASSSSSSSSTDSGSGSPSSSNDEAADKAVKGSTDTKSPTAEQSDSTSESSAASADSTAKADDETAAPTKKSTRHRSSDRTSSTPAAKQPERAPAAAAAGTQPSARRAEAVDSDATPTASTAHVTPTAVAATAAAPAALRAVAADSVDTPKAPARAIAVWSVLATATRQAEEFMRSIVRDISNSLAALSRSISTVATPMPTALRVTAVSNAAPSASPPTFGTPDPVTGAVSGALNVTDPNGDPLTYTVKTAPPGGTVTVAANGTFRYTPSQATRLLAGATLAPDTDRFVVSVTDGSASTSVTVDVPVHSGQLSAGKATQVGLSPSGIVTHGDRIYTANTSSNTITAIDARTNAVIASVPVGKAPTHVAVSPDGSVLYVANSGSNTVSAISTVTGATLATMAVGGSPQGLAVNPAGTRIYVTNTASNSVTVLNAATRQTVSTIKVGAAPTGVAISADGARVYIANRGANTVSAIQTATNTVAATYSVGTTPQSVVLNSAGTRLYVTNVGSDNVTVINTSSGARVATITVGDQPFGMVLSRDGSLGYVVNGDSTMSVINTATNTKVTGTLRIESTLGSMVAVSPDGNTVYTTFAGGTTYRTTSLVHFDPPPSNPGSAAPAVVDNFTGAAGTRPDSALWSPYLAAGGATGELAAYTDSARNASLDGNGNLVIRAIKEPITVPGYGTFDYSSAFLSTQDKLEFTYGTVAARIKFPAEQGLLPAFWMLASDTDTVGWPLAGEIDVMEVANTGTFQGSSMHGAGYDLSTAITGDLSAAFHEYWVRWEPNKITTGVDGVTLATFTPDSLPPGSPWTYNNRSMYAILNLSVGSPFGQPDATTELPAAMVVDWFRYTPL